MKGGAALFGGPGGMVHNLPKIEHQPNPRHSSTNTLQKGGATVFGGPGRVVHNLPKNTAKEDSKSSFSHIRTFFFPKKGRLPSPRTPGPRK